jgi:hypothetical protein
MRARVSSQGCRSRRHHRPATTHMILLRLQGGHDADPGARLGRLGGDQQSEEDTELMEPRSRGDVAADVGFDHPGTHAVDDDERAGWRNKPSVSPDVSAANGDGGSDEEEVEMGFDGFGDSLLTRRPALGPVC